MSLITDTNKPLLPPARCMPTALEKEILEVRKIEQAVHKQLKELIEEEHTKKAIEAIAGRWNTFNSNSGALLQLLSDAEDILGKSPHLLSRFPPNLQQLIKSTRTMRKALSDEIDIWIRGILQTYKPAGTIRDIVGVSNKELEVNAFAAVIKKYSYMDLSKMKGWMVDRILECYLPEPTQCKERPEAFAHTLKKLQADCARESDDSIAAIFLKECVSKYNWVKANLPNMQAAYNQGDDAARNQGTGTCAQNSAERQALLHKNPATSTKDLPMGSSAKGRFVRAKFGVRKAFPIPKDADDKTKEKAFIDTYTPFGINKTGELDLDGLENLAPLFEACSEPLLFRIETKGSGHVINVQCDPERNIYRFIDDNTGSFDYKTQEAFLEQFTDYLKAFYPDSKHSVRRTELI